MGLIGIILAIIQAIPTVIKLIEIIRDLLKNRSPEDKKVFAGELKGVLQRWRAHRNSKRAAEELEQVIRKLQD